VDDFQAKLGLSFSEYIAEHKEVIQKIKNSRAQAPTKEKALLEEMKVDDELKKAKYETQLLLSRVEKVERELQTIKQAQPPAQSQYSR